MGSEEEVTRKINDYQELAKSNKNIDVASLMINALEQAQREEVDAKKKKRAYMVSVIAPPLGLFFAVRYFFSDKDDGKRVALICVILTAIALLGAWLIGAMLFSGGGGDAALQQVQTLNVSDLQRLMQP
jgi:hypothetical protein